MLSYHNDPAVKLKYQARFATHRAADEVTQGIGFENGRGCFVGCTLDRYDHSQFPVELGWPEWLARLADQVFEGLPATDAPQFGTDLLEAVQVGKDLEPVRWLLAAQRHTRDLERLAQNAEPYARQCEAAIRQVIAYCEAQLAESATEEMRSAARSAAESARSAARSAAESAWSAAESAWSAAESAWSAAWSAESAAWSAARSAAWSAARSAAESGWSARSAAWSAAESAAWSAAESAHFQWEAETLLVLLRNM